MLGSVVGLAVMGAAIYSVAFMDWKKTPPLGMTNVEFRMSNYGIVSLYQFNNIKM